MPRVIRTVGQGALAIVLAATLALSGLPAAAGVAHAITTEEVCAYNLKYVQRISDSQAQAQCAEIMAGLENDAWIRGMTPTDTRLLKVCASAIVRKGGDVGGLVNECFRILGYSGNNPGNPSPLQLPLGSFTEGEKLVAACLLDLVSEENVQQQQIEACLMGLMPTVGTAVSPAEAKQACGIALDILGAINDPSYGQIGAAVQSTCARMAA